MSSVHFVLISSQWLHLVFLLISSSCRRNDSARSFLLAFRLHFVATTTSSLKLLKPPSVCARRLFQEHPPLFLCEQPVPKNV